MKSFLIIATLVFGIIAAVGVLTEHMVLLTIGAGGATLSLNIKNNSEEQ